MQTWWNCSVCGICLYIRSLKKWIAPPIKQLWRLKVFKTDKKDFLPVFSEGVGKCIKVKPCFQLKEKTVSLFKPKRSVLFAVVEPINIEEYGFWHSDEKCQLLRYNINCFWQISDANGRRPDPSRSNAIKNLLALTNNGNLQSFPGHASY